MRKSVSMILLPFTVPNVESVVSIGRIFFVPERFISYSEKFGITPKDALAQYCETYIGCNSRFPVVRLKPQGTIKRCPLLKNRKCMVHDVKPAVCAMFPIGRYLALPADGNISENLKESSVGYIFNNPECGDDPKHIPFVNGFIILIFQ